MGNECHGLGNWDNGINATLRKHLSWPEGTRLEGGDRVAPASKARPKQPGGGLMKHSLACPLRNVSHPLAPEWNLISASAPIE